MPVRTIVQIDEEKCDGCGECVPSCAEGAIRIIDGKARIVSDVYCDGLGACLGHCPQDAIKIIERDAVEFDEAAVQRRLAGEGDSPIFPAGKPGQSPDTAAACDHPSGGCPGAAVQSFGLNVLPSTPAGADSSRVPQLSHWPVQLSLVPPTAPFLQGADLLLTAQCAAFTMADFHEKLMQQNPIAIACPKLDDSQAHLDKLTAILQMSDVKSLSVIRMEVPCCTGLIRIAQAAIAASGKDIPLSNVTVSIRGEVIQQA